MGPPFDIWFYHVYIGGGLEGGREGRREGGGGEGREGGGGGEEGGEREEGGGREGLGVKGVVGNCSFILTGVREMKKRTLSAISWFNAAPRGGGVGEKWLQKQKNNPLYGENSVVRQLVGRKRELVGEEEWGGLAKEVERGEYFFFVFERWEESMVGLSLFWGVHPFDVVGGHLKNTKKKPTYFLKGLFIYI